MLQVCFKSLVGQLGTMLWIAASLVFAFSDVYAAPQGSTLTVEEPMLTPSAGIRPREVMDLVLSHVGEVSRCQRIARISGGKINGRIVYRFKIEKRMGTVDGLEIKSNTTGDSSLADCIAEKIQKWPFPHPKDPVDVVVELPLRFAPN
jgi:hypothetical protein